MKRTVWLGAVLSVVVLSVCLVLRAAESVDPEDGIAVSPSTLVMGSQGVWVTVHANIPYGEVDGLNVWLNGIPVVFTKADNQGELVAKFQIDAVKGIVEPPSAEVTLVALTNDGDEFTGTDTIRVVGTTGR